MPTSGVWDITRWDASVWTEESVPYTPLLEDYTALIQSVIDLIRDTKIDSPRAELFIRQAHDKLQRDLLNDRYGGSVPRQMLARGEGTTTSESNVTLPADFIIARDVIIQGAPSRYVSQEKVQSKAPGYGESAVTLDYYWRIPLLSDANPTNWLFLIAPDVYLYGAALQYVPWAQEWDKQAGWDGFYTDALEGVKESNSPQPRGGWTSQKGGYRSVYTIVGDTMIFGANQDIRS